MNLQPYPFLELFALKHILSDICFNLSKLSWGKCLRLEIPSFVDKLIRILKCSLELFPSVCFLLDLGIKHQHKYQGYFYSILFVSNRQSARDLVREIDRLCKIWSFLKKIMMKLNLRLIIWYRLKKLHFFNINNLTYVKPPLILPCRFYPFWRSRASDSALPSAWRRRSPARSQQNSG